jgi:hypothetical protein
MPKYDKYGIVEPETQSGQDIKEDIKARVNAKGVSDKAKDLYQLEKNNPGYVKMYSKGVAYRTPKKSYKT